MTVLLTAAVTYVTLSCSAFGPAVPFTRLLHDVNQRNGNDIFHPHHYYFHRFKNSPFCLFLERNSGGDGDENDPETWTFDTKPFTAIRYFARDDVTDEEIRKVLSDNAILTMEDLKSKSGRVTYLLDDDIFSLH
jgi:hypothetical protein